MSEHKEKQTLIRLMDREGTDGPADLLGKRLADLATCMDRVHEFKKGQLLKWKPGLKHKKYPAYEEPVIVRNVLDPPVFSAYAEDNSAGSPYFGEPLTLVIALVEPEGDFLEFRVDGRRFEPFNS